PLSNVTDWIAEATKARFKVPILARHLGISCAFGKRAEGEPAATGRQSSAADGFFQVFDPSAGS
ncbi:MAG: hypothetical protein ACRD2G_07520, partial [Terriglobia bacterium]